MTTTVEKTVSIPIVGSLRGKTSREIIERLKGIDGLADIRMDDERHRISFNFSGKDANNGQIGRAIQEIRSLGLDVPLIKEKIDIFNMHCAGCVAAIENGLKGISGIADARVNFATQTGEVDIIEGVYNPENLLSDIRKIGYNAAFQVEEREYGLKRVRMRRKLSMAVAFSALIVLLHFIVHIFGWVHLDPRVMAVTQLLLTLPVLFAGQLFFTDAWRQLRHRRANMNSLIALGAGSAFLYSVVNTIIIFTAASPGQVPLFYETTAMIIIFIMIGKYFELKATNEARDAASGMSSLIPRKVTRIDGGGHEETVKIDELRAQDVVIVRPGQAIPSDGVIVEGEAAIDESLLTGEAMPATRKVGDRVVGGTVNLTGGIKVKISRMGKGTVLSQMIRMVQEAQTGKAPIQRLADRVAGVFVPIVIMIAIVTLLAWWIFDPESSLLWTAPVAVLLIACPCALGLATPTAILVATGRSARMGILFRNGAVLEKFTEARCFIFDKTGTLTDGRPIVEKLLPADGVSEHELLQIAASVEQYSEHPFGTAIRDKAKLNDIEILPTAQFEYSPGRGVIADVNGKAALVGNRQFILDSDLPVEQKEMLGNGEEEGTSRVYIIYNKRYLGAIMLNDNIKKGATEAVSFFRENNFEVVMLTGDNRLAAGRVAARVGITRIEAEALPEKKLATIQSLRRIGLSIAMVGDGVNDAAALAAADIGIAVGTGADVAMKASDITITGNSLEAVVSAFDIARKTMRIIKQNLFWAFFYNVIMIPIAAGLFYPMFNFSFTPVMAAIAMSLSSIIVVFNSMRLRKMPLVQVVEKA